MLLALNLKSILIDDPVDRPKPLAFNERTGHVLPLEDNLMQDQLDNLKLFADGKLLKIKEKKSNLIKFNFSKNYDFPPELVVNGFKDQLQVISEVKLLGIMITSDLKWSKNTNYICKKHTEKCGL